jgi:hypothetical protein
MGVAEWDQMEGDPGGILLKASELHVVRENESVSPYTP